MYVSRVSVAALLMAAATVPAVPAHADGVPVLPVIRIAFQGTGPSTEPFYQKVESPAWSCKAPVLTAPGKWDVVCTPTQTPPGTEYVCATVTSFAVAVLPSDAPTVTAVCGKINAVSTATAASPVTPRAALTVVNEFVCTIDISAIGAGTTYAGGCALN